MKSGIGNTANDKSVNVSTRGAIDVLSVEMVDKQGNQIIPGSSFNIPQYDTINLTYTVNGDIATVVYKLATVTVATLTLTYDTNRNLITVVQS